jgi:hypothetical protein
VSGRHEADLDRAFAGVRSLLQVQWSGPKRVRDLSDRRDRARTYDVLPREGTAGDLWRYIGGALLVDLWNELVLPAEIKAAWVPRMLAAKGWA